MDDYQRKIREQIEQYRFAENIHELPKIFHYWSNAYLLPRMDRVLGVGTIEDLYAAHFRPPEGRRGGPPTFLSVGCGDCSLEIGIARRLRGMGVDAFVFECLDLSHYLLGRAAEALRAEGLSGHFRLVEADILAWSPAQPYRGVMASHALHHFVELEALFAKIRACLEPDGVFVSCDMIGRNGHMRWPEALALIEPLWRALPDRYKFDHQHRRFRAAFEDWDCSTEGFEGIRAQDILPLLVRSFSFRKFLAFGNLVDVFIDRSYGFNLDPEAPEDRAFIDFLETLNGILIDVGYLKPTQMMAVMGLEGGPPVVHRHWTPGFCIRDPQSPPAVPGP